MTSKLSKQKENLADIDGEISKLEEESSKLENKLLEASKSNKELSQSRERYESVREELRSWMNRKFSEHQELINSMEKQLATQEK